eukprot:jgi/Mesvir1/13319/Mv25514-RA.1
MRDRLQMKHLREWMATKGMKRVPPKCPTSWAALKRRRDKKQCLKTSLPRKPRKKRPAKRKTCIQLARTYPPSNALRRRWSNGQCKRVRSSMVDKYRARNPGSRTIPHMFLHQLPDKRRGQSCRKLGEKYPPPRELMRRWGLGQCKGVRDSMYSRWKGENPDTRPDIIWGAM